MRGDAGSDLQGDISDGKPPVSAAGKWQANVMGSSSFLVDANLSEKGNTSNEEQSLAGEMTHGKVNDFESDHMNPRAGDRHQVASDGVGIVLRAQSEQQVFDGANARTGIECAQQLELSCTTTREAGAFLGRGSYTSKSLQGASRATEPKGYLSRRDRCESGEDQRRQTCPRVCPTSTLVRITEDSLHAIAPGGGERGKSDVSTSSNSILGRENFGGGLESGMLPGRHPRGMHDSFFASCPILAVGNSGADEGRACCFQAKEGTSQREGRAVECRSASAGVPVQTERSARSSETPDGLLAGCATQANGGNRVDTCLGKSRADSTPAKQSAPRFTAWLNHQTHECASDSLQTHIKSCDHNAARAFTSAGDMAGTAVEMHARTRLLAVDVGVGWGTDEEKQDQTQRRQGRKCVRRDDEPESTCQMAVEPGGDNEPNGTFYTRSGDRGGNNQPGPERREHGTGAAARPACHRHDVLQRDAETSGSPRMKGQGAAWIEAAGRWESCRSTDDTTPVRCAEKIAPSLRTNVTGDDRSQSLSVSEHSCHAEGSGGSVREGEAPAVFLRKCRSVSPNTGNPGSLGGRRCDPGDGRSVAATGSSSGASERRVRATSSERRGVSHSSKRTGRRHFSLEKRSSSTPCRRRRSACHASKRLSREENCLSGSVASRHRSASAPAVCLSASVRHSGQPADPPRVEELPSHAFERKGGSPSRRKQQSGLEKGTMENPGTPKPGCRSDSPRGRNRQGAGYSSSSCSSEYSLSESQVPCSVSSVQNKRQRSCHADLPGKAEFSDSGNEGDEAAATQWCAGLSRSVSDGIIDSPPRCESASGGNRGPHTGLEAGSSSRGRTPESENDVVLFEGRGTDEDEAKSGVPERSPKRTCLVPSEQCRSLCQDQCKSEAADPLKRCCSASPTRSQDFSSEQLHASGDFCCRGNNSEKICRGKLRWSSERLGGFCPECLSGKGDDGSFASENTAGHSSAKMHSTVQTQAGRCCSVARCVKLEASDSALAELGLPDAPRTSCGGLASGGRALADRVEHRRSNDKVVCSEHEGLVDPVKTRGNGVRKELQDQSRCSGQAAPWLSTWEFCSEGKSSGHEQRQTSAGAASAQDDPPSAGRRTAAAPGQPDSRGGLTSLSSVQDRNGDSSKFRYSGVEFPPCVAHVLFSSTGKGNVGDGEKSTGGGKFPGHRAWLKKSVTESAEAVRETRKEEDVEEPVKKRHKPDEAAGQPGNSRQRQGRI